MRKLAVGFIVGITLALAGTAAARVAVHPGPPPAQQRVAAPSDQTPGTPGQRATTAAASENRGQQVSSVARDNYGHGAGDQIAGAHGRTVAALASGGRQATIPISGTASPEVKEPSATPEPKAAPESEHDRHTRASESETEHAPETD